MHQLSNLWIIDLERLPLFKEGFGLVDGWRRRPGRQYPAPLNRGVVVVVVVVMVIVVIVVVVVVVVVVFVVVVRVMVVALWRRGCGRADGE